MKVRSIKLSIRISDSEQQQIAEDAHKSSMAVSSYARKKILAEPIRDKLRKLELCQGRIENMSNSY